MPIGTTPDEIELNRAFQAAIDDLDKAATTTRKMIRRARTADEAETLQAELARMNRKIEEVAIIRFEQLAQSDKIREIIDHLNAETAKMNKEREKMTNAAKTIAAVGNVIDIVSQALDAAKRIV